MPSRKCGIYFASDALFKTLATEEDERAGKGGAAGSYSSRRARALSNLR